MIERIRKIGIITKGFVYVLIGLLTLLAAMNIGGKVAGKNGVISFLQDQVFGNIILILLAVGLFGYAIWRIYSGLMDAKNEGKDKVGTVKRVGYVISGVIYGLLGVSVFYSVIGNSGNGDTKESAANFLLNQSYGQILMVAVALIMLGVGVYQFYKGISMKFLEDIDIRKNIESREALEKSGMIGFIARGFSFAIFAYFAFRAAMQDNANAVEGVEGMFNFIQGFKMGDVLMGIMAIGLLCYGVYQYFLARYSNKFA